MAKRSTDFNSSPSPLDADDNGNNQFDQAVGSGAAADSPNSASTPEPATLALLCLGMAGVLVWRVRREL